jgi:rhodanese-related sulfurtransferase
MAASYANLFEGVDGAGAGKALHLVSPEALVNDLDAGADVVLLDVRTAGETGLFTFSRPGSLVIAANEVFMPQNLDRLPTDRNVVVVCKSGARAAAVGTALRHIGFNNVYILKGGFQALSSYYGTKQAN